MKQSFLKVIYIFVGVVFFAFPSAVFAKPCGTIWQTLPGANNPKQIVCEEKNTYAECLSEWKGSVFRPVAATHMVIKYFFLDDTSVACAKVEQNFNKDKEATMALLSCLFVGGSTNIDNISDTAPQPDVCKTQWDKSAFDAMGSAPVVTQNLCWCKISVIGDGSIQKVSGLNVQSNCHDQNDYYLNGARVSLTSCTWGLVAPSSSASGISKKDESTPVTSALPTSAELSQKLNPLGTFTPQELLGRVIKSVLGILGSIALVIFLYGGITWMTSMGSSEKIQKSLSTIVWGALGVIVILASYSIVGFVLENIPK